MDTEGVRRISLSQRILLTLLKYYLGHQSVKVISIPVYTISSGHGGGGGGGGCKFFSCSDIISVNLFSKFH